MAGPRSPRREEGEGTDDESTDQVDDPVLAILDSWIRSGRSKDLIIKQIQKRIDPKELRRAVARIKSENWAVLTLPQEQREDYSRKLADTAFKALEEIQQQSPLKVQFWISAKDLSMVPGSMSVLDELDETAVCARLNTVDTSLQLVLDRLEKTERLEASVSSLATTVTNLQIELREHQAASEAARLASGQITSKGATWAGRVARGLPERLQDDSRRARSPSLKRGPEGSATGREENRSKVPRQESQGLHQELEQARSIRAIHPEPPGSAMSQSLQSTRTTREEGYEMVQRRRLKRSVLNKGSAKVDAEGGVLAPYSVFVSGTSPSCTTDQVREVAAVCCRCWWRSGGGGQAGDNKY